MLMLTKKNKLCSGTLWEEEEESQTKNYNANDSGKSVKRLRIARRGKQMVRTG